jgi:hypothetical protein
LLIFDGIFSELDEELLPPFEQAAVLTKAKVATAAIASFLLNFIG